jgi:hypothetical protein
MKRNYFHTAISVKFNFYFSLLRAHSFAHSALGRVGDVFVAANWGKSPIATIFTRTISSIIVGDFANGAKGAQFSFAREQKCLKDS